MSGWFGKDLIEFHESYVTESLIQSSGRELHVEEYIHHKDAPTLLFAHGIAGYARVLLPFIKPLYDRGINVICPDLTGYGYNDHRKGDFSWSEHAGNLVDVLAWARRRVSGPLYIGGASMGGPLAYEAACRSGLADGLICWCLWDMSDREFIRNETFLGSVALAFLPLMRFLGKAAGSLRIKTTMAVSYDTLTDDPRFNKTVLRDPQAGTLISLRGVVSLICDSRPSVSYEKFNLPALVFQPMEDAMTPPRYSKKAFAAIGSQRKEFVEVEGSPHFPTDRSVYDIWGCKVSDFMRNQVAFD